MTDIITTTPATVPPENRSIEQVSSMREQLSRAREVPDMKRIRNAAEAMAILAFREGYYEVHQQAMILVLESERTLGRWLKDNVNHKGGNPDWSEYQGLPDGISKKESHYYQLEAALPEEKFRSWVNSCIAENKEFGPGILRKIARQHRNGGEPVDDILPSFDTMRERALYWIKLILKHYFYRFHELTREIIKEYKAVRGEWR